MINLCIKINTYEPHIIHTIINKCRFKPKTNDELKFAVDTWCYNKLKPVQKKYGSIEVWDTSLITNMSKLFECNCIFLAASKCYCGKRRRFNADISSWDVSNVTNMNNMFSYCDFFDQDLSRWDVSSVISNEQMFSGEWGEFNKEYLPNFKHSGNKYTKNKYTKGDNNEKRRKLE